MIGKVKEWILEKEFSFHRIETLIYSLGASSIILMTVVIPFMEKYTTNTIIHISLFVVAYILIVSYWYYNRTVFPKNENKKKHIVIAIITENAKQKIRIKNDFSKQIKKQIIEMGLDSSYDITVLHNHQSDSLQNKISLYTQSLKASLPDSASVIKFNKLIKRLNAKFIIYGDLIQRNSENSTYCLSLEAMILHKPTNLKSGKTLHEEFLKLWNKEIIFLEKEELTGFKENAKQILFTASYMLGLVTFVDNNYAQGIKIWEGLETHILKNPELNSHLENIKRLKTAQYFIYSRYLYFDGQIKESLTYRTKYLELFPNEYDNYLTEAINQIKIRNDPELALDFVKKAEKIAPKNEGTWRYNELYLLIRLKRCEEALVTLENIIQFNYPDELDIIYQVLSYNKTCLDENSKHIQSHFIIGALLYKKLKLPIPAYEKLELFINEGNGYSDFEPLIVKAKEYIAEINKVIGVSN